MINLSLATADILAGNPMEFVVAFGQGTYPKKGKRWRFLQSGYSSPALEGYCKSSTAALADFDCDIGTLNTANSQADASVWRAWYKPWPSSCLDGQTVRGVSNGDFSDRTVTSWPSQGAYVSAQMAWRYTGSVVMDGPESGPSAPCSTYGSDINTTVTDLILEIAQGTAYHATNRIKNMPGDFSWASVPNPVIGTWGQPCDGFTWGSSITPGHIRPCHVAWPDKTSCGPDSGFSDTECYDIGRGAVIPIDGSQPPTAYQYLIGSNALVMAGVPALAVTCSWGCQTIYDNQVGGMNPPSGAFATGYACKLGGDYNNCVLSSQLCTSSVGDIGPSSQYYNGGVTWMPNSVQGCSNLLSLAVIAPNITRAPAPAAAKSASRSADRSVTQTVSKLYGFGPTATSAPNSTTSASAYTNVTASSTNPATGATSSTTTGGFTSSTTSTSGTTMTSTSGTVPSSTTGQPSTTAQASSTTTAAPVTSTSTSAAVTASTLVSTATSTTEEPGTWPPGSPTTSVASCGTIACGVGIVRVDPWNLLFSSGFTVGRAISDGDVSDLCIRAICSGFNCTTTMELSGAYSLPYTIQDCSQPAVTRVENNLGENIGSAYWSRFRCC